MLTARRYSIVPWNASAEGVSRGVLTRVVIPCNRSAGKSEDKKEKEGNDRRGEGGHSGADSGVDRQRDEDVSAGKHVCTRCYRCAPCESDALRSTLHQMRETVAQMREELAQIQRKRDEYEPRHAVEHRERMSAKDNNDDPDSLTPLSQSVPSPSTIGTRDFTKVAFLRVGKALSEQFARAQRADKMTRPDDGLPREQQGSALSKSITDVTQCRRRRRSNTL